MYINILGFGKCKRGLDEIRVYILFKIVIFFIKDDIGYI